jgi:hypothetical protein
MNLRAAEKSTWWGIERKSWISQSKKSSERLTWSSLVQLAWPERPNEERGIMVCRTTPERQKMNLGMALP